MQLNPYEYYPTPQQVDEWAEDIRKLGVSGALGQEVLGDTGMDKRISVRYLPDYGYVRFSCSYSCDFYAYWQPAAKTPAPLVVNVPGYGAEITMLPTIVDRGYNVLHICPLGYITPDGPDLSKMEGYADWPVLPQQIESGGERGYRHWLANCVQAIEWARSLPEVLADRLSFMGSSQGGGGSLLLASVYQGDGARCVGADVPFLTNHPLAAGRGAYHHTMEGFQHTEDEAKGWYGAGLADTLSHAHRLQLPVLLTIGELDETCPAETIRSLHERLSDTSALFYMKGVGHGYTLPFIKMAEAWLELYA